MTIGEKFMRAMVLPSFGDPSLFRSEELPTPKPAAGEVLVRIAAASVNAIDTKLRRLGGPMAPNAPVILGCDMAGVVEAVGEGVANVKPGDRVMGMVGGVKGMPGTYAEYASVDARVLAQVPSNLPLGKAAALPLAALTVWMNLVERAGLRSGDSVLVTGGAGGVGTIAVQIASALGASVISTCRADDAKLVRELGAKATVDYRSATAASELKRLSNGAGYDIVFDAAGLGSLESLFAAARFGGKVVSLIDPGQQNLTPMRGSHLSLYVSGILFWLAKGIDRAGAGRMLNEVSKLVANGSLKPIVDPISFRLDDVGQAHSRLEAGVALGKIVIDIDEKASGSR